MTEIKSQFSTPPTQAIASYNYTDVANGLGYTVFYLNNSQESATFDGAVTTTLQLNPNLIEGDVADYTSGYPTVQNVFTASTTL